MGFPFGNAALVRDVMVGGIWWVEDGHHAGEEGIAAEYKRALAAAME
jgi:hypothetical protein